MPRMIFVNLPVADVEKASAFYQAVGAIKDERFCQEGVAAGLSFSDTVKLMLLSRERFADFTPKRIIDATSEVQMLTALSEESAAAVDVTLDRAVGAGGKADPTPRQEMGDFMYGRSFEDLDGHIIELMWMDVDKAMAAWSEAPAQPATIND